MPTTEPNDEITRILTKVDTSKTENNPEGNPFIPGNLSVAEAREAIQRLIVEVRADERKRARTLYAKRNPQYTKQWIADYLGVSRPTLNKWLKNPEEFTLGAVLKLSSLNTKQENS